MELCQNIHTVEEIDDIITHYRVNTTRKHRGVEYYNFPCSFDIETTSFVNETKEKQAIMYIWQFGFNGQVIIGRTWGEFDYLLQRLVHRLQLSELRRLIVYVHNLGFEFQFMRKHIKWSSNGIFSMSKYKPLKASAINGLEFRCSYLLSGMSLEKVAENLNTYKIKKLSGELDYSIIRTPITPLTEAELAYCVNDVLILNAYIQEEIENNGNNITKIPLTKTGYVRQDIRNSCFYIKGVKHDNPESAKKFKKYRKMIKNLIIKNVSEYELLKEAFQGGFTHANIEYVNNIMYDVASYDFTSAYPTVLVCEKFPMSSGEVVKINNNEDEFFKNIDLYCCLFKVKFKNLRLRDDAPDCIISQSKSFIPRSFVNKTDSEIKKLKKDKNYLFKYTKDMSIINNGRVYYAPELVTTITDVDFTSIEQFYTWDKMYVDEMIRYKRGYLPKDFIIPLLEYYRIKTEYKDVPEKIVEYMVSKGMLNSAYGMLVMDIIRADIMYDLTDKWSEKSISKMTLEEKESAISKYNNSTKRFTYYPWGVWVTAYARRNLFTGILEAGEDYIYSDTDSIKILNYKKHSEYFEWYNNMIVKKLEKALDYHGLDRSLIRPKTIYGEEKVLGIWEFEGVYKKFKTLGAKRYMTLAYNNKKKKDELVITVSGLNKKKGSEYFTKVFGLDKAFDEFRDDMKVPAKCLVNETDSDDLIELECTGKLTHTYIDNEMSGVLVDYLGNRYEYHELSGVHLAPQDYSLKLADVYADLINKFKGGMIDDWKQN